MNRVQEIETALLQLPPQERWEVARWLLEDLGAAPAQIVAGTPVRESGKNYSVPDYSARRRRIFGDKIVPNMVLAARADERW